MKVNVYTKNGVLIKEFGVDPECSTPPGVRTVSECRKHTETEYKISFDDGLYPDYGMIYGDVIVIKY